MQVRNGIIQQFRLVTAYTEFNIRIQRSKIIGCLLQLLFHGIHILIALLDNGQRHRPFSSGNGTSHFFLRNNIYFAEFLQLHNAFPFTDIDIPYILRCTEQSGYADIIFIIAIPHQHASRFHIIVGERVLYILHTNARYGQFIFIRKYLQKSSGHSGYIRHGHFG